jgi:hypothetical protein
MWIAMLHSNATSNRGTTRRLRLASLVLFVTSLLAAPTLAAASGPIDEGTVECAQCHHKEAEVWGTSPHARALDVIEDSLKPTADDSECLSCHTTHYDVAAHTYEHSGVTCEACHGEYVQGHPQTGVMNLKVDSSTCQDCHNTTYGEWQTEAHAQVGVQCISCHQPHSQTTRLDDAALCASCHQERTTIFEHTAHSVSGMTCVDCHLPLHSEGASSVSSGTTVLVSGRSAPDHSFKPAAESCVGCHASNVHQQVVNEKAVQIGATTLVNMTERTQTLARELDDAKRENRSLQAMTVVSLGFGLGLGGVLGIIFMLVIGYLAREKSAT